MRKTAFLFVVSFLTLSLGWSSEIPKTVLVTGGAGYIGTQTCKALEEAGFTPIIYDNFSRSQDVGLKWGTVEKGDISDRQRLSQVIDKHRPVAVVHCAGFKAVGESIKDPVKYYLNNLCGSIVLLDVMKEKGLKKIIFSSTGSAYGIAEASLPFREKQRCDPINPYGTSKWMVEKILGDFKEAYGFHYVIFRYFNVAGADLKGECGERGSSPNNLVPIILQVASEKRKELEVFGCDYPTTDGTAIRDYIHVADLADAHVKALRYLLLEKPSITLNLGTGTGASVMEVVHMARLITKKPILTKNVPRRIGDPPSMTADPQLAKDLLGWEPKNSDLKTIIESEWKWNQSLDSNNL